MGNYSSYVLSAKAFYVYKRRIDTDSYEKDHVQMWQTIEKAEALSRFKHELYAFSLGKYDYDDNTKAIYLYYGGTRLIRAGIVNNQVVIESNQCLPEYLECNETLPPGRAPLLKKEFEKNWFRNYARLNVHTVGFVKNSRTSF